MGGIVDMIFGGDDPVAPDTRPMAAASEKAAELGAALGQAQLDENKRQYDSNKAALQPIVDSQLATMAQTQAQGKDYFDYQKTFRPAEQQLLTDANDPKAAAEDAAMRDSITGSDASVYTANQGEIDANVSRAVADTQGNFTRTANQIARQGLRYGIAPGSSRQSGQMLTDQATATASTANGARDAAIAGVRGRLSTKRSMKIQDTATTFARKLDAVGIAKGLPGASVGAYGQATAAGNSASSNTMAPGAQYMQGIAQGNSTIMGGQQMAIGGLGSVLNAQASAYGNQVAMRGQNMDFIGGMVGAGIGKFGG